MRNKSVSFLLIFLLVCSLFTACSAKDDPADALLDTAWDAAGAQPEYLTQWPDNVFTEKIVPPQSGSVDYALDYTDSGRYAIFIKDISLEGSEEYVKELESIGYSEIRSAAGGVSVGRLFEGNEAYLSISYSEVILGLVITPKEDPR